MSVWRGEEGRESGRGGFTAGVRTRQESRQPKQPDYCVGSQSGSKTLRWKQPGSQAARQAATHLRRGEALEVCCEALWARQTACVRAILFNLCAVQQGGPVVGEGLSRRVQSRCYILGCTHCAHRSPAASLPPAVVHVCVHVLLALQLLAAKAPNKGNNLPPGCCAGACYPPSPRAPPDNPRAGPIAEYPLSLHPPWLPSMTSTGTVEASGCAKRRYESQRGW